MKRFVPVLLAALALAVVPVALADNGGSTTTTPTPAAAGPLAGHPIARMRLQILRLRVDIVRVRVARLCFVASSDRCTAFLQKVEQRLQTLDTNVEQKITDLKACTSTSTDQSCKNADKKIAVLTKVDTRLQALIQALQKRLDGSTTTSTDSSLNHDAGSLGQAAGSLGSLGPNG